MRLHRSFRVFVVLALSLFLAVLFLEYCKPAGTEKKALADNNPYVGDAQCQSCHAKEYSQWQGSDHFKAMLPANDTTVLGDFNNASYTADGVTSRFFRKDGKFFINTEGPDGRNHDYEVLYTFGYKPLQQYLVAFPGGKMQVPRVSWDVNKKKWFHQYAGQKIHHNDWLHWTGGGQNWNTMCASCHSTDLKKNYFAEADSFHTTYAVMNVSCESCHGPGKKHIDFVQSASYKKGDKVKYSYLQALDTPNHVQVNACAPCHARKADIHAGAADNRDLMNSIIPEIPTTEFFHADGQVDDEDYIYTSYLQSKMFHRGVKCTNCHNPHSGQLVLPATTVCLQCHEKKFESIEHTGHEASLTQVNCISCHMPGKFYMGNDYRHDHSFRVPRPDLSVKHGTPNACNNCHNNKTAQWAADAVSKWHGPQRKYHFADDLVPASKGGQQAEQSIQRLLADTAVPYIVKATAVDYLRTVPTSNARNLAVQSLRSPDPQVRYRAVRVLGAFDPAGVKDDVMPLLNDKVRAVRIAAADVLLTLPVEQIPVEFRDVYGKAKQELYDYVMYQSDFAVGNVMIGDHFYRQNDLLNAEKYYVRGLRKDSMMNYVRFNLSSLYNAQGKNREALNVLQEAKTTDPSNPRAYYNLALLYVELNDMPNALSNFKKAASLRPDDPRIYYNYALLLQQQGNAAEAEQQFRKGLALAPTDPSLNYALAVLYMQQRQPSKAMEPAMALKRVDPSNPQYQQLFKALRLN